MYLPQIKPHSNRCQYPVMNYLGDNNFPQQFVSTQINSELSDCLFAWYILLNSTAHIENL